VSPEHPEEDEFLEDDEQEEYGQRSIFATGWFRAVLVLLVLAVIAVIAVPLIGGWFEPTPPLKTTSKPIEPAPAPTPSTPPPAAAPTPSAQMPSAGTPSAAPAAPPAVATPSTPPPAVTAPARPEMPTEAPSKAVEKPAEKKPAEHVAAATPGKSARPAAAGSYWVQVGAFKQSRNAEGLAKKLRTEGFPVQVARVTREEALHVVRVGGYPDRSKATAAREELQGKGHAGFVTQGPAK
jgi:cell division septation protein DedD